eukprot:gene18251-24704_t
MTTTGAVSSFATIAGGIGMHGGLPHPSTFPFTKMSFEGQTLSASHLPVQDAAVAAAQQYCFNPQGYPPLVELLDNLSKKMQQPQCDVSVAVTTGATLAIDCIINLLLNRGDPLLCEEFCYSHALEAQFVPRGLQLVAVPMDSEGLMPTALDSIMHARQEAGKALPKVLYTIPRGQNPTGASMSMTRLKDLYAVAQKWDIVIIEDDAYFWLQQPEQEGGEAKGLQLDRTMGAATLSQVTIHGLLSSWGMPGLHEFVKTTQEHYTRLAALHHAAALKFLTGVATWEKPKAGMFMWMKLKGHTCSDTLLESCLKHGVMIVPGRAFWAAGIIESQRESVLGQAGKPPYCPFFRLSFASTAESSIEEGYTRLRASIDACAPHATIEVCAPHAKPPRHCAASGSSISDGEEVAAASQVMNIDACAPPARPSQHRAASGSSVSEREEEAASQEINIDVCASHAKPPQHLAANGKPASDGEVAAALYCRKIDPGDDILQVPTSSIEDYTFDAAATMEGTRSWDQCDNGTGQLKPPMKDARNQSEKGKLEVSSHDLAQVRPEQRTMGPSDPSESPDPSHQVNQLNKFPRTPHLYNLGAATRDDLVLGSADVTEMLSSPHLTIGRTRVLYGEWVCALHTVAYDKLPDWFIAFDILDTTLQHSQSSAGLTAFLSRSERDRLLASTSIYTIHTVHTGPLASITALVDLLMKTNSAYCTEAVQAEGLYLRVEVGGVLKRRAKLVHPAFLQAIEVSGSHWSKRAMQHNLQKMESSGCYICYRHGVICLVGPVVEAVAAQLTPHVPEKEHLMKHNKFGSSHHITLLDPSEVKALTMHCDEGGPMNHWASATELAMACNGMICTALGVIKAYMHGPGVDKSMSALDAAGADLDTICLLASAMSCARTAGGANLEVAAQVRPSSQAATHQQPQKPIRSPILAAAQAPHLASVLLLHTLIEHEGITDPRATEQRTSLLQLAMRLLQSSSNYTKANATSTSNVNANSNSISQSNSISHSIPNTISTSTFNANANANSTSNFDVNFNSNLTAAFNANANSTSNFDANANSDLTAACALALLARMSGQQGDFAMCLEHAESALQALTPRIASMSVTCTSDPSTSGESTSDTSESTSGAITSGSNSHGTRTYHK